MTDLLVYWRDCRRNREGASTGVERVWHSSSRWVGELERGDRMWLVTSGQVLGRKPVRHGFLVEIWKVEEVVPNRGDLAGYPSGRYAHRVLARLDNALTPSEPADVDRFVRPQGSSTSASIGRLLQGPRRLKPEAVEWLTSLLQADGRAVRVVDEGNANDGPCGLDRNIVALGIRQPWAELILRGVKTIEVRTLETNRRGAIYLYSSKTIAEIPAAQRAVREHEIDIESLPTGRIVGSADVTGCRSCVSADAAAACVPASMLKGKFAWELASPQRLNEPVRPRFLPYGIWFYPFRRRNQEPAR